MRIFISLCMMFALAACGKSPKSQLGNGSQDRVIIGKLINVDTDYTSSMKVKDTYGDEVEVCGSSVATFEVFTERAAPSTAIKFKQMLDDDCENSFYDTAYYTKYQIIFFKDTPGADGIIEVSNSFIDASNPFFLFNIYQFDGQLYADISDENISIELRDENTDVVDEDIIIVDSLRPDADVHILSLNELLENYQLSDNVANLSAPVYVTIWNPDLWKSIDSVTKFSDLHNTAYRSKDGDNNVYLNRALILNTAYPEITAYILANENVPKQ